MARNKEKSELEHLRGQNRQLRKQVKSLQKQLGRHQKEIKNLKVNESPDKDRLPMSYQEEEFDACPVCDGELRYIDMKIKTVVNCSSCEYRRTELND